MNDQPKSKGDSSELPPVNETPRDVRDIAEVAIPVDEFYVAEWAEGNKGRKSRPSQVHIVLSLDEPNNIAFSLRLKSKRRVSELIEALKRHRDAVWP